MIAGWRHVDMTRRRFLEELQGIPTDEWYPHAIARHLGRSATGVSEMLRRLESLGELRSEREEGDPCQLGRPLRFYFRPAES